jgi:hypothetical protein
MKYLFLAYGDKRQWEAMSEAEREALTSACAANDEALRLLGYLLCAETSGRSSTLTRRRPMMRSKRPGCQGGHRLLAGVAPGATGPCHWVPCPWLAGCRASFARPRGPWSAGCAGPACGGS